MALAPHVAGGSSGVSLVYPLLSSTNYTEWAAILDSHGLWEVGNPAESETVDTHKDKTAKERWDSLETRFGGADRVKAARLSILKGEFDFMRMKEGESLDDYANKISGMAGRYDSLGATLDNTTMVKKLLDTVPDRFYPVVAEIEHFYDVEEMSFEEALGRLKAFDKRSRWGTRLRCML